MLLTKYLKGLRPEMASGPTTTDDDEVFPGVEKTPISFKAVTSSQLAFAHLYGLEVLNVPEKEHANFHLCMGVYTSPYSHESAARRDGAYFHGVDSGPSGRATRQTRVYIRGKVKHSTLTTEELFPTSTTLMSIGDVLHTSKRVNNRKRAEFANSQAHHKDEAIRELEYLSGYYSMPRPNAISGLLSSYVGAWVRVVPTLTEKGDMEFNFTMTPFGESASFARYRRTYTVEAAFGKTPDVLITIAGTLLHMEPDYPFMIKRNIKTMLMARRVPGVLHPKSYDFHRKLVALESDLFVLPQSQPLAFDNSKPLHELVIEDAFSALDIERALPRPGGFSTWLNTYANVEYGTFGLHVASRGRPTKMDRTVDRATFFAARTLDPEKRFMLFYVCKYGKIFWSEMFFRTNIPLMVKKHAAEANKMAATVSKNAFRPHEDTERDYESPEARYAHDDFDERDYEDERPERGRKHRARKRGKSKFHSDDQEDDLNVEKARIGRNFAKTRRERGGGRRNDRRQRKLQEAIYEHRPDD